jgi:hypothetical protein
MSKRQNRRHLRRLGEEAEELLTPLSNATTGEKGMVIMQALLRPQEMHLNDAVESFLQVAAIAPAAPAAVAPEAGTAAERRETEDLRKLREKLLDDVQKYKIVQQRRAAAAATATAGPSGVAAARPTPEQLEAAGVITTDELVTMKNRQGHRFGRGSRMMSPSFG